MRTFLTTVKAAVVALAMGAGALGSMPAQAQGFTFEFGFGNGFEQRFPRLCLTDRQLRNAIEDQGYHSVYLNVPRDNRIQAKATRGSWVYLLEVNVCSGRIIDRERLRRA
jgi:hypothetical protein